MARATLDPIPKAAEEEGEREVEHAEVEIRGEEGVMKHAKVDIGGEEERVMDHANAQSRG